MCQVYGPEEAKCTLAKDESNYSRGARCVLRKIYAKFGSGKLVYLTR